MNQKTTFSPALQEATGEILYGLTNDYMFRILFQKNKLDIKMILNTHQQIDLEMQVNDYHDWPERSIGYLCRMYDSLEHGEEYIDTKPAIHIGILDYTPFPEQPLFYSKNQIMDVNTQRIYSDKFTIFVLDLSKVDLATQDDCLWGINKWAKLFKATLVTTFTLYYNISIPNISYCNLQFVQIPAVFPLGIPHIFAEKVLPFVAVQTYYIIELYAHNIEKALSTAVYNGLIP